MAGRKAAFKLTPVGGREGRYDVSPVEGAATPGDNRSGRFIKGASPRSKAVIEGIVRTHAVGLKRLADR